ncbi:hypothetical protein Bhyg_06069, partial [Pseudolycoriella hygida]
MILMKVFAAVISIIAVFLLNNVSGVSIKPITVELRICGENQYRNTDSSGNVECLECPLVKPASCPDGSWPVKSKPVENECPKYTCPKEPVMCTLDFKICAEDQYLGTGSSGCPECLQCPLVKPARCPDGSWPVKIQNECPKLTCPKKPVMCTLDLKICAEGEYLGTGSSGCPECLQCPLVKPARCPDGSWPVKSKSVQNECPKL